jgi:hypothetical protein
MSLTEIVTNCWSIRRKFLTSDTFRLPDSPYTLKSQVSLADFREFVAALEGETVTIKNDNLRGLSRLCDVLRFRDLATQLSQFREFVDFKEEAVHLLALEERLDRLQALIERLAVPVEAGLRTHKEKVAASTAALEERMQQRDQEVAALQADL